MTKSMLQLAMLIGVITAVLGFTNAAHAGWSDDVRITSMEVSSVFDPEVSGVWLAFNEPPHQPSCSFTTSYVLGGGTTNINTNVNRMMALATEALLNSRTVRVYWGNECSDDGYPILLGIILR